MGYNYRCPRCNSREVVFKEIAGDKIVFYCRFCQEDFITKDREEGFLPSKIESLRKRYPPEKKEKRAEKRLAHRQNFKQQRY